MRKLATIFTILMLVGSVTYGQDVFPIINGGTIGILYQFSGFAALGASSYQGGLGAKLFLSNTMAVRGGVQLMFISAKQPFTPPTPPVAGWHSEDATTSAKSFGVTAAIELHLSKGRVSPYIGGGATFATTSTEENSGTLA